MILTIDQHQHILNKEVVTISFITFLIGVAVGGICILIINNSVIQEERLKALQSQERASKHYNYAESLITKYRTKLHKLKNNK